MIPPFDLFQMGSDGSVLWLESTGTLEDAAARLQALPLSSPKEEYIIFNQQTGQKFAVKFDGAAVVLVPAVLGASAPQQLGESE